MKVQYDNWLYFKFEVLPEEVRKQNKIKSQKRLDCTSYFTENGMRGLNAFINTKGQLFLYKQKRGAFISSKRKMYSDIALTHGSWNLTSLIGDVPNKLHYAYGHPYPERCTRSGSINPFHQFKDDLYLFHFDSELNCIEMIIVPNERKQYNAHFHNLLNDLYQEAFDKLRSQARPFFNYAL